LLELRFHFINIIVFYLQSTYLKGLAVCKDPHKELIPLYNRILRVLGKFPEDYTYRKETEGTIKNRLKIVQEVKQCYNE